MSESMVRRQGYAYCLVNIECLPNSDHFNVLMDLDEPVEELFPYLASIFPGCSYVHTTGVLHLMDRGHIVAIYPTRITITDVAGDEEAERLCEHYYGKITQVAAQRESVTPIYHKRPSLTVLDIFRSLPKTNCGLCDSPTCMAFAARVFRREDVIGSCDPVRHGLHDSRDLLQLLQQNGYETP